MDEYIKRDDAMQEIDNMHQKPNLLIVRERLAKIPAADVKEVRHGEWVERMHFDCDGNHSHSYFECSVCGSSDWYEESNYCPNCGAKMKG